MRGMTHLLYKINGENGFERMRPMSLGVDHFSSNIALQNQKERTIPNNPLKAYPRLCE